MDSGLAGYSHQRAILTDSAGLAGRNSVADSERYFKGALGMTVADNLDDVRRRIAAACGRSGRSIHEVQLLPVTKSVDVSAIDVLAQLGIRCFGENRVDQAVERYKQYPEFEWHLIGSLQTNKAQHCRGFALIHSLDRESLAKRMNRLAESWETPVPMLLQVNVSGEASKHGLAPDAVAAFADLVLQRYPNVRIQGLMTMAPLTAPEETRPCFRRLKELQLRLQTSTGLGLGTLSMGMTNDFEVAVEEGSTLVRVGTALFS